MKGIQVELPEAAGGDLLGRVVELVRTTTTTTTEERIVVHEDDEDERAAPVNASRIAGPVVIRPPQEIVVPDAAEGGRR